MNHAYRALAPSGALLLGAAAGVSPARADDLLVGPPAAAADQRATSCSGSRRT